MNSVVSVIEEKKDSKRQDGRLREVASRKAGSEAEKVWLRYPPEYRRILIIDDERKIRVLFSSVLAKAGYATVSFADNVQAVEYLRNNRTPIDLLVLDLNMPNIDGRYFSEMVRFRHPKAKILIASNYSLDTQKYIILDADGYFDKSEGINALKEKVRRMLSHRSRSKKVW